MVISSVSTLMVALMLVALPAYSSALDCIAGETLQVGTVAAPNTPWVPELLPFQRALHRYAVDYMNIIHTWSSMSMLPRSITRPHLRPGGVCQLHKSPAAYRAPGSRGGVDTMLSAQAAPTAKSDHAGVCPGQHLRAVRRGHIQSRLWQPDMHPLHDRGFLCRERDFMLLH